MKKLTPREREKVDGVATALYEALLTGNHEAVHSIRQELATAAELGIIPVSLAIDMALPPLALGISRRRDN